jgi:hypothetical protein
MKPDKVPDTVQALVAQAGGLGMRGAFVYVGARYVTYQCAQSEGEYRSDHPSRLGMKRGRGCVEFDVGVKFDVNARRGRAWKMIITYEPDDTYTVWLIEGHSNRQLDSMVLACQRDVYCDTLRSVIEATYDKAIREHNQGFIPLS